MIELRHSTTCIVKVGPVVNTTGVTPVTTLTIDGADEAEILKWNTTATLAISGTLTAITNCDGYYNLTLAASELSEKGPLALAINDDDTCLPVRCNFMVVDAKYYDSKYSTTLWNVNVESISGDTAAADTLETHIEGSTLFKVDVDAIRTTTATASDISTAITNITTILSNTVIINSNTAEVRGDLVNGGRLDLIFDGIETHVHTTDGHITADYSATEKSAIDLLDDAVGGLADIHTDIGTMAGVVNSIASLLVSVSSVTTIINSNAAAILADTNEMQTDLVNGGRLDLLIDSIIAKTNNIPTSPIATDSVVEGTITYTQALRVCLAALAGKLSGGGTVTLNFRDTADSKNRIQATVDANGNRTAITLDVS